MNQSTRLLRIKHLLEKQEEATLSSWASYNSKGIRRVEENLDGHRQAYAVDCDRILHSKSYTRYIDKTQVFYMIDNDHITHRVLHVQLVSKIGRTIGRFLGLNEDLIEATALGHDIGHPPFGHDGEIILSKICLANGLDHFLHNAQSVRFLDKLEKKGKGLNLTLQVLDGILCHDGEIHLNELVPESMSSFKDFDKKLLCKSKNPKRPITPMTLEGCVVRMADTIAYIGRDIEDAIELKLITRDDIPTECAKILGKTNGTIVYTLVTDLIDNSYQSNKIAFSPSISDALQELKQFNYKRIYLNPYIKNGLDKISECYIALFDSYLHHLDTKDYASAIFKNSADEVDRFTNSENNQLSRAKKVRDFIAGMTDDFFLSQAKSLGCSLPTNK
jgi:dGTPase